MTSQLGDRMEQRSKLELELVNGKWVMGVDDDVVVDDVKVTDVIARLTSSTDLRRVSLMAITQDMSSSLTMTRSL